jgi:hypothetical protein
MSVAELLARCRALGVELGIDPGGAALVWEADAEPPTDLLADLARHKADLLDLLARPQQSAPALAWDQTEADRLLAQLREVLVRTEAAVAVRKTPAVRLAVLRLWSEVAEGYINDRERETARGWDALALLRAAVARALSLGTPPAPMRTSP